VRMESEWILGRFSGGGVELESTSSG
jgi:hypothetical protein